MLSLILSQILALLFAPLRFAMAFLREWVLGRRGVVEVVVAPPVRQRTLEHHVQTLHALRLVARSSVRAVFVRLEGAQMGWATVQELQKALAEVREKGKLVVVHCDSASNGEMFLAAPADRIWLTPAGDVNLHGIGARLTFFAGILDKLGIQADIESAGAYKSMGESYTRTHPSAENREAISAVVTDLHEQLVESLMKWRKLNRETVDRAMAQSPLSADEAKEYGLVDDVLYADQARSEVEDLLGGSQRRIGLGFLSTWLRIEGWLERVGRRRDRVAVVHLQGPIFNRGDSAPGQRMQIVPGRVVPALDRLRQDDGVRGVVLYVDSPGGSALASDVIARAVTRLAEAKPVVAVFGNTAASGGYYLAAPCAELIAQGGTLTGSIGVVGGKMVWAQGADQVGITSESVAAGPNADAMSPWSKFNPEQRERFRESLRRTYARFLAIVAAGRHAPVDAIEPVAQGRVWTGRQAKENGLVDSIGGLSEGIDRVSYLAGLPSADVTEIHVRFPNSVRHMLANRGVFSMFDLAVRELGVRGQLLQLLRDQPMEPMAITTVMLDD